MRMGRSLHATLSSRWLRVLCLLFLQLPLHSFSSPLQWGAFRAKFVGGPRQTHALPWKTEEETKALDTTTTAQDGRVDSIATTTTTTTRKDLPFFANWPRWLQHAIRDHGGVGIVLDTATRVLAAPLFYLENPWCFPEFVRISGHEYPWLVSAFRKLGLLADNRPNVRFDKLRYGDHPQQVAQVMITEDARTLETTTHQSAPLFVFLHGGAWGSGFPTMYRLLSLPFLERNFRAVILGYRTYPEATIQGQVDDLVQALDRITREYSGGGAALAPVVLMGHSSGAHVCLLAALTGRLPASVRGVIGASGVYDLEAHYHYEQTRGLSHISPMAPTNGGTLQTFRRNSPTQLLRQQQPRQGRSTSSDRIANIPPTLLLHGGADEVVLPQLSKDLSRLLGEETCTLQILEGVGHQQVVTDACLGGESQSVICDWIEATLDLRTRT